MVNFGLLTAELFWRVWGIPGALLHGTLVVGISQTFGVEQRAPPIFGRADITLGIGPHFSYIQILPKILRFTFVEIFSKISLL